MLVRLQKYIADQGICSRRKAEELIVAGKVKVNGELAKIGMKVDGEKDKVEVSQTDDLMITTATAGSRPHGGKGLNDFDKNKESNEIKKQLIYIALNKPIDYICSTTSEQGTAVLELLTPENYVRPDGRGVDVRVYPVGRLDKDSEGLVLLTNDGELTNILTHPRYEHEKEYEVIINSPLSREAKKVLSYGMVIDGEEHSGIRIVKEFNKGRITIVNVILREGKNRQVRKMFGRLGYRVMTLRRVRIGKLKLGVLPPGKWRFVGKEQIV